MGEVCFADFAAYCTCNATSLIPHEHTDCAALRLYYQADSLNQKKHELEFLREQVKEYEAALEYYVETRNAHELGIAVVSNYKTNDLAKAVLAKWREGEGK